MQLLVCQDCDFGHVQDGKSHCSKESCYSYLAKCIKNKALEDYLARNVITEIGSLAAGR